jgi:hypothetical protein
MARAYGVGEQMTSSEKETPKQFRVSALFRAGLTKIKPILRPVYWPMRSVFRFVLWAFPVLGKLLSRRSANGRRVLAVYDVSVQPFSVGDLLIFQEASLVLCEKHQVDVVDFAIVYDPRDPASSDPVFSESVTEDNVMYHLASLLPIAQVNQKLGSLFVFNSHAHLQRYINDNADRYHVWPSGWLIATREYLSPIIFNDLLYSHYKEHGSIPYLSCRQFLKDWAEDFYRRNVCPKVPVTVNLRNNKGWHLHRNSTIDCWIEFFQHCESRYPAKFVVICARAEIDDRLRDCSNVILAKDYHTGVEQDMALIHTSAMHMGAGSGPATMAWFNNKPYLMVNTTYKIGEFFERPGMIRQEERDIQRFWFAGPLQRVANGTETAELLIREFALMWEAVDKEPWQSAANAVGRPGAGLQTWLR